MSGIDRLLAAAVSLTHSGNEIKINCYAKWASRRHQTWPKIEAEILFWIFRSTFLRAQLLPASRNVSARTECIRRAYFWKWINVEVLENRRRLRQPHIRRFDSNFGSTSSQLGVHITSATAPSTSWQRRIDVYSKHHNFCFGFLWCDDYRIFSAGFVYLHVASAIAPHRIHLPFRLNAYFVKRIHFLERNFIRQNLM